METSAHELEGKTFITAKLKSGQPVLELSSTRETLPISLDKGINSNFEKLGHFKVKFQRNRKDDIWFWVMGEKIWTDIPSSRSVKGMPSHSAIANKLISGSNSLGSHPLPPITIIDDSFSGNVFRIAASGGRDLKTLTERLLSYSRGARSSVEVTNLDNGFYLWNPNNEASPKESLLCSRCRIWKPTSGPVDPKTTTSAGYSIEMPDEALTVEDACDFEFGIPVECFVDCWGALG